MSLTNEIIALIEEQLFYLHSTRSLFPYVTAKQVGRTEFDTPPYYSERGFRMRLNFEHPLTESEVAKISRTRHWINQNYVIRLFAILEANGIIPKEGQEGQSAR